MKTQWCWGCVLLWTSQTLVNQPAGDGVKFHGIGDSSPTDTLLKQEGLQLAEASFRDVFVWGFGFRSQVFLELKACWIKRCRKSMHFNAFQCWKKLEGISIWWDSIGIWYLGLSENRLNPYSQWFCWSLSLLNGYFIGGIPNIFRHTHLRIVSLVYHATLLWKIPDPVGCIWHSQNLHGSFPCRPHCQTDPSTSACQSVADEIGVKLGYHQRHKHRYNVTKSQTIGI